MVWVTEIHDGLAEVLAHFVHQLRVEVLVRILPEITATERRFDRVSVHQPQFFVDHHPCTPLFLFVHAEGAVIEAEYGTTLLQQFGINFFFEGGLVVCQIHELAAVALHEDIFLATVSVKIHVEHHFPLLHEPLDEHFGVENRWVQPARRITPLSVQIHSS